VILLDTNVLSEMFKPAPNARVMAWLDRQNHQTLYISAVTQAELLYGVYRLPDGARKKRLLLAIQESLALLEGRVLSFDAAASDQMAIACVQAERSGIRVTAQMPTSQRQLSLMALP